MNYLVEKGQYQKACALALALASGRRKSELCRLKVSYFSDNNIIYGSLYKTPETVKTKGRGRGKFIPIYVVVDSFKKYFDLWMEERKRENIESEWLLVGKQEEDGTYSQMSTTTLDSWAITFTNIIGKPFYWHSLRHFFVSELQRAGIPDGVIQEIVNWETADMVKLYSDLTADEQIGKYFGAGKADDENPLSKL